MQTKSQTDKIWTPLPTWKPSYTKFLWRMRIGGRYKLWVDGSWSLARGSQPPLYSMFRSWLSFEHDSWFAWLIVRGPEIAVFNTTFVHGGIFLLLQPCPNDSFCFEKKSHPCGISRYKVQQIHWYDINEHVNAWWQLSCLTTRRVYFHVVAPLLHAEVLCWPYA